MASAADIMFMQRALELAARGRFRTAPNPMVGAVIVKNRRIIGEGYHRRAGSDHAEIAAIKNATAPVKGATVYVTLEPCCHTGRTGPCTEALIEHGFKRVVFAAKDPDPRVAGKGARRLRRAGIKVESGLLQEEANHLNESYVGYHRLGRPYIILKTAQTLDGRIAASSGDSQWITSAESRRRGHALRASVDGLVVGMDTVRADDPSLTVRHVKGPNPYRIVLSSSLKFPRVCRLLDDNSDYRTIVASNAAAVERFSRRKRGRGLIFWTVKANRKGLLDVDDLVNHADRFGLRSLLVEGGSQVATAFLNAGLVDKYVAFVAPLMLGQGIESIGDLKSKKIADAIEFEHAEFTPSGKDIMFTGYPKWRR